MKYKIYLFIFAFLPILSPGGAARIFACGSYQYAPSVCEMYGKSKAVFVGKIVAITELKKGEDTASDFRVDFQVQESFLGVKNATRVSLLVSSTSPEYCGFEQNKSYLVYAYKGDYGFSIDAGTRTRAIANAEEDLEFLRNLAKSADGARVYGTITRAVKSSLEENNKTPVPGMRLKIEGTSQKRGPFYAVTDESGHYEVRAIPGGKYKISPVKEPSGYYFAPEFGSSGFEVNDKGCVSYNFTLTTNNKFVGKIIDAEGNPVEYIDVEILSVNAKRPDGYVGEEYTNTSSNGTFYAYNITPGLYTVSINYSKPPGDRAPFPTFFYPGVPERSQAAVIEIKAGVDINDFEFRLPPRLNPKLIKGRVIRPDGTPATGVRVYLKDDEFDVCCIDHGVKTDDQGNFTIMGYEGRNYHIWSSNWQNNQSNPATYGTAQISSADTGKTYTIILNLTEKQLNEILK